MNKLATFLFVPFMGLMLSACQINSCYESTNENKTTLKETPKRAQGSYTSFSIWLCAPSNYEFQGLTDEGYPIQGGQIGLVYLADQQQGDFFTLWDWNANDWENFDVYTTEETANSQAEIKDLKGWTLQAENLATIDFVGYASVPYPYICVVPTNGIGRITIHNAKPENSGPVNVYNEDLETLASAFPNGTTTLDRLSILESETILTTDSVVCNVGTTLGGNDVATSIRNYTITFETPLEIWVTSNQPFFTINNETPWDLTYTRQTIYNIDQNTSYYNLQRYRETLDYTLNQPTTIISDYPFQIWVNDHETATVATKNTDRGTYYDLYGKYYITLDSAIASEGTIIKIEGSSGSAENTLQGTFATIAMAFTALIPILQLNVIGNITIGALLLIPFTFALITLIFRLIKK